MAFYFLIRKYTNSCNLKVLSVIDPVFCNKPPPTAIKEPHVAGHFYPADGHACKAAVDSHLAVAHNNPIQAAKVLIAPHAGLQFSGAVAGSIYAGLKDRTPRIQRVVLLGPAHRVAFKGIASTSADYWRSPLGLVPVDWDSLRKALSLPHVAIRDGAFKGEHSMEVHLPFLQRVLGPFQLVPLLVGDADKATVSAAIDRLWGGPETLIVISSDLSHFHDYDTATAQDGKTSQLIELGHGEKLTAQHACGHRAIVGALDQPRRRDLRITAIDVRNSGDTYGNKSRVVGYGAFAMEHAAGARLDAASRQQILAAARMALEHGSRHGKPVKVRYGSNLPAGLLAMRASFVTVELDRRLRGCIGSVVPHRQLLPDIITNTYKAGFGDPRFAPMSREEVSHAHVSVSILSHARQLTFQNEDELIAQVRPDQDGLILRDGKRQGLFLPSVWRSIPKAEDFVRRLKNKAGLPLDHWSSDLTVSRFSTESFGAAVKDLPDAS